ncbi:MAG: SGNH/GDSL hydrolase family protein [Planctomycetota bacterium]
MRMTGCLVSLTVFIGGVAAAQDQNRPARSKHPSARWESAIQKFEEQDRKNAPKQNHVLFVGSSSIRMWKLDQSFPDIKPINRGFGGSQIADSIHFADRLILKHRPRIVVLYAGDNDLAKGKTPARVEADFREFVVTIHKSLPETKIVFIAVKPSIARWNLIEQVRAANAAVAEICSKNDRLEFVDIDKPMIGDNGQPREDLFLKDGLHLNDDGYAIWTNLVRPHIVD